MPRAHPDNAPGDWYVEHGCCLTCAVPHTTAPGLFGWARDPIEGRVDHCFVQRQPAGPEETAQLVEGARNADMGCIRYRGRDERVKAALRDGDAGSAIDEPA